MADFKIYPITSLINSLYIPDFFEPIHISTSNDTLTLGDNFVIERDLNGLDSIIHLTRIPFIDLSKYDNERRKWYAVDKYDGLWRLYDTNEWVIERGRINNDAVYTNYGIVHTQAVVSKEGLLDGDVYDFHEGMFNPTTMWKYNMLVEHNIQQYKPIKLSINKVDLTDLTNYSGNENVVTKLDDVDPNNNKEFYYNFGNIIYTNQDLSIYNPDDILLEYTINIDKININCRMNTNVTNLSPYTPVVDFFITTLTGQNL